METLALARDDFSPIVLDPLESLRAILSKKNFLSEKIDENENPLTSIQLYPQILKEVIKPEEAEVDPKPKVDSKPREDLKAKVEDNMKSTDSEVKNSEDKESSATEGKGEEEEEEGGDIGDEEIFTVDDGAKTIKSIANNLTVLW